MLSKLAYICILSFSMHIAGAQKLIFKTYTVSDGLVANPVRRIFQDSKGFLWICTWEGLSKYDGDKFTNFTTANGLSDNSVNDVYESKDGKLYVALNTGVVDVIQNDQVIKKAGFRNIVINRFYASPDHRIFAVTDASGIWELKNDHFVKPEQQDPNRSYYNIISFNDSTFTVCSPEITYRIFNSDFKIITESQPTNPVNECIFK